MKVCFEILSKEVKNDRNRRESKIRVRNNSHLADAVLDVDLYRWRFRTSAAMEPLTNWARITVPAGKVVTPAEEFYYTYQCADALEIKWKAVVVLRNGADPNLANNIVYKKVTVHRAGGACP